MIHLFFLPFLSCCVSSFSPVLADHYSSRTLRKTLLTMTNISCARANLKPELMCDASVKVYIRIVSYIFDKSYSIVCIYF